MSVNKVILIGNLGGDVEVKTFEDGGKVGNFSLATSESYVKKDTGEKITNTEWHRIVVRNSQADVAAKYLTKGSKIYLEGRIKTRKYENQQGVAVYLTEVIVSNFVFLDTKSQTSTSTPPLVNTNDSDNEPDDLPF